MFTITEDNLKDLTGQNTIIEIGHKNTGHLSFLFDINRNIHYTGLEMSELMYQEAIARNLKYIKNTQLLFLF